MTLGSRRWRTKASNGGMVKSRWHWIVAQLQDQNWDLKFGKFREEPPLPCHVSHSYLVYRPSQLHFCQPWTHAFLSTIQVMHLDCMSYSVIPALPTAYLCAHSVRVNHSVQCMCLLSNSCSINQSGCLICWHARLNRITSKACLCQLKKSDRHKAAHSQWHYSRNDLHPHYTPPDNGCKERYL